MIIKLIPQGHPFEQEPMARRVSQREGIVMLTQAEYAALKVELEAFNNASSEIEAK